MGGFSLFRGSVGATNSSSSRSVLGQGKHFSMFELRSGDPIAAGDELCRYDSRVEEKFACDGAQRRGPVRAATRGCGWGTDVPDFELVHRHEPKRRWLLEIVGFWTAEYLKEKLARLRAAGLAHLILCIDGRRQCHDAELPEDARVIRYKSKIDPRAVMAIVGR
jgi:predicted nuclease of restriction endonuclease-like RecB superfamily